MTATYRILFLSLTFVLLLVLSGWKSGNIGIGAAAVPDCESEESLAQACVAVGCTGFTSPCATMPCDRCFESGSGGEICLAVVSRFTCMGGTDWE